MTLFRRSCPLPGSRHRPWHRRLRTALTAPIGRYLSRQAAHPHGPIGRLIAWNWLRETATVNDIAIELLQPRAGEHICEIGSGPGRTLHRLATTGAHVTGIDISPTMVAVATRRTATTDTPVHVIEGD